MAEQKRRNAGAEPISRHPLFPAIVALWAGALFGLASIVVSPSVIESLVLATGIHKVIPMAAPPLGTTTRILLALAATGLGGAIGFLAARRLARPAVVPEAAGEPETAAPSQDATAESATPGRIAGRRRALALNAAEDVAPFDDHAPVPGRDAPADDLAMPAPQILNVAEFDLDGFEDAPAEPAASPAFRPRIAAIEIGDAEADAALPAWLDAETAWHEPEAEPDVLPSIPAGVQGFQQVFQAQLHDTPAEDTVAEDTVAENAVEEDEDENAPAAQPAPGFKLLPRLQSGEPVTAEVSYPPFAAPAPVESPPAEPEVVAEITDEIADEPVAIVPPVADAPIAEAPFVPAFEPRRIAEADLDDLSPVELLERLALAMAERREQARRAAAEAEERARAPIAVEFAPLREVPPSPAPEGQGYAPPFERLAPAPFAAPAPFVTPVIESGMDAGDTIATPAIEIANDAADDTASDTPSGFAEDHAAPVPATPVPAALRPVAFDDGDLADAPVPGYVRPRHIGLTAIDSGPFAAAAFPASPFLEDEADGEDDAALQQGYSSLLNLSRLSGPRNNLARAIRFADEDEAPQGEPAQEIVGEPFQDAVPFARPTLAPQADPAPAPERLFDAPGHAEPTTPEATERALRAALATLQRMSGAA
ncbi:MAG TPA: hypothetical protein VMQ93_16585 [Novosphingobium sp.]|nr:hypothetical protein [Novosphingobium sp.]